MSARLRLPGELWGVATYFNPAGYESKRANLERFARAVRAQGLRLLLVELRGAEEANDAAPGVEAELADRVLRLRSDAVLWHKERMLNEGIAALPAACDKVVWLDADVLFEDPGWVESCASALELHPVVQPFELACWLPAGTCWLPPERFTPGMGELHCMPSMASELHTHPDRERALVNFMTHGHTGFAWAARRSLLARHGLYDRLILGGGDGAIAQAFYTAGDPGRSPYPAALRADIQSWREKLQADVRGDVGYLPGRLLHLWHGALSDRRYDQRIAILHEAGFDPRLDLRAEPGCSWGWGRDNSELHRRIRDYFTARREDG